MEVPCRRGVFYDALHGSSPPFSTKERNTTLPHALSLLAGGGRPPPRGGSSSRQSLGGYSTCPPRAKHNSPSRRSPHNVGVPSATNKDRAAPDQHPRGEGACQSTKNKRKHLQTVLRATIPGATSPPVGRAIADWVPVASSSVGGRVPTLPESPCRDARSLLARRTLRPPVSQSQT